MCQNAGLFSDLSDIFAVNSLYLLGRDISFVIGIIIIIILTLIIFNKKNNESSGCIDNATGVAILIELAKLLQKEPLENLDVIFL